MATSNNEVGISRVVSEVGRRGGATYTDSEDELRVASAGPGITITQRQVVPSVAAGAEAVDYLIDGSGLYESGATSYNAYDLFGLDDAARRVQFSTGEEYPSISTDLLTTTSAKSLGADEISADLLLGPKVVVKRAIVPDLTLELGVDAGELGSESMFELAKELHEIRTEFAHAQGYSSEARTRISRLSARIKALKEFHASQLTSLRVEYEERLKAATEREDAVRNLLSDKVEAAETRAEQAEREIEILQTQLADERGRVTELEQLRNNAENMLKTTEDSYKMQIERMRKQIAQLNEDHGKMVNDMRAKNDTLRQQVNTMTVQLKTGARESKTPESRQGLEVSVEKKITVVEAYKVEKESLEKQLEQLTEKHIKDLEGMEEKHQRIISEVVSLREENRGIRTETQTYKAEVERLQREIRASQLAKLSARLLNVGVQVTASDVIRNLRHAITQTEFREEAGGSTKVVEESTVVQRVVQQPQIIQVPVPMIQQAPQVMTQHVQSHGDYDRLRTDYESLQRRFNVLQAESRVYQQQAQTAANTSQTSSSFNFVAPTSGGVTTVRDDKLVHDLQEKLYTAERARMQMLSEMHEKLAAKEQEWMAKQHQFELKIISVQGEKERDVQAKEFKFQGERNELLAARKDLEGRVERLTRDKDQLTKDYETKLVKVREEVARVERDLDRTKKENKEIATRLDSVSQERATFAAKSNSLEQRVQMITSERSSMAAAIQQQVAEGKAPEGSAAAVLEYEARLQEQRRAYERIQKENDELANELREVQRKYRNAQNELEEVRLTPTAAPQVREVIRERSVEREASPAPAPRRQQVVVQRAITPIPATVEPDIRRRIERKDREIVFLRTRAEEFERKFLRSQELVADLTRKARLVETNPKLEAERNRAVKAHAALLQVVQNLKARLAERESVVISSDVHVERRVHVLEQQLNQRRDRIAQLERELDDMRMTLAVREESISNLKRDIETRVSGVKVVEETKSSGPATVVVDVSSKVAAEGARAEAERYKQLAAELEIRLKRSQLVVQQLFAIIERSRQNNIKFAQGVMELQLRHLGTERGAELQILQSDRSIAELIKLTEETTLISSGALSGIASSERIAVTGDLHSIDQSLHDMESRLKREMERSTAEQQQLASQLSAFQRQITDSSGGASSSWKL